MKKLLVLSLVTFITSISTFAYDNDYSFQRQYEGSYSSEKSLARFGNSGNNANSNWSKTHTEQIYRPNSESYGTPRSYEKPLYKFGSSSKL